MPGAETACREVFDNVVNCLTTNYPNSYVLKGIGDERAIHNLMTNEFFYLNTKTPLEDASRLSMDDFNILGKDYKKSQYYLFASATLFPAG